MSKREEPVLPSMDLSNILRNMKKAKQQTMNHEPETMNHEPGNHEP
jgi:hypothetical protein